MGYHRQVLCTLVYMMELAYELERDGKLELAYVLEQGGKQVCELVQRGKLEQYRELEHAQCWQLHELKCLHG